jgi:hypothetical protein
MSHSHEHVASVSGAPADAFTREATYAATRRPVELAQTLLPEAYTSEAFFALARPVEIVGPAVIRAADKALDAGLIRRQELRRAVAADARTPRRCLRISATCPRGPPAIVSRSGR